MNIAARMTMPPTDPAPEPRQRFRTDPLYAQVQELILSRIADGTYQGNLTNEHDLSREVGVSAGTMRKALEALEARGIIRRVQGRGTFLRPAEPWEALPAPARLVADLLGCVPSADPAERRLMTPAAIAAEELARAGANLPPPAQPGLADGVYTAARLREVLAAGAAELAAWLERRALAAAAAGRKG